MPDQNLPTFKPQEDDSVLLLRQRQTGALASIEAKQDAIIAALGGEAPSSAATIGKVQTDATGANWTTLPDLPCKKVAVLNFSDADIEVRRGGAGEGLPIPSYGGYVFEALSNANALSLRRVDQSNSPVTINYEAIS